jgi:peptidoglycan/xylan/chitin deacetylase (PgdA/CDA1 family)/HEAT repeat protein
MKRVRPYHVLLLFALAIGLAGYIVWPREPIYQGRDLSEWLGDVVPVEGYGPTVDGSESARRAWDISHEPTVTAVRSIGTNALPHLLRWLRFDPRPPPLRDKLQELLNKQSLVRIRLPRRHDHRGQAIIGFQALGSAAEPALPELRRLLHNPATCYGAVFALRAIGPIAVPILATELINSNCPMQICVVDALVNLAPSAAPGIVPVLVDGVTNPACLVHEWCLIGLGALGPMAREYAPWLATLAQQSANPLAGLALRVLGEDSDRPEQYLPLFSDRLNDTNFATHAAFALGRMGPGGLPPLLRALTNQEPSIRGAALAALDPKLRTRRTSNGAESPTRPFSYLSDDFDLRSRLWLNNSRAAPGMLYLEDLVIPIGLEKVLDHPDAGVRRQIVQLLARYGYHSALGLSRAAADTNETVRAEAQAVLAGLRIEVRDGGITRGPTDQKKIALLFAGHEYAEGGETIFNELARHKAQASFFITGDFLRRRDFNPLARRLYREGHYLGPHSDKHLLYCSAAEPAHTLVTRDQFNDDLRVNLSAVQSIGDSGPFPSYFLPPHERYNLEIAEWAAHYFYTTIGYTPGTRSTADCTREADPDFVSSQAIFDSIVAREQEDPHGLNGFLLLFHLGSGPARTDKFHARFGELLDYLTGKGYQFVAVDDLFDPQAAEERRSRIRENPPLPPAAEEAFRRRYGLDR